MDKPKQRVDKILEILREQYDPTQGPPSTIDKN